MDERLMDTCRITGIKKTSENASEFQTCSKCNGITHKSALTDRGECRCSYCGEKL